jgi:2-iminobutanoate/2-iminopropanoate deaminase
MTAKRQPVDAPDAPAALGPYSHAVRHGSLLYCSGQIPIDPAGGETVTDSLGAETGQCMRNVEAVCRAAGTDLSQAVSMTIYTTQIEQFAEINEAYGEFFADSPPSRATVGVAALPKGVRVEISAIVAIED